MNKETKLTKKLYSSMVLKEWKRLEKNALHKLEFDTTIKFLKKFLPKKGFILDAGGGPGRYTIALAKAGYNVALLDLVPENIDYAKRKIIKTGTAKRVKQTTVGSITDLSIYKDKTFDATICLGGPLSHVYPEKMRRKAISELVRVTKVGSPIFISVMSKLGTLTCCPGSPWEGEISRTKDFNRFAIKGDDYLWHHGKGYCHFFDIVELKNLVQSKKNIEILDQVGLEGLGSSHEKEIDKMSKKPKIWKNWLKVHERFCTHPSVVDTSLHMMIIFKRIK
ncbi:MAG: class I SAM-dependent methyltransferase [Patescibacteria group bacterium]|nr:class I SAM-dependent methyltransferase [Patescibacteria group bacterium]MDD5121587.1 class I SAM-dependent methyltransferase [Patescibacteria group bacterium]MDD5222327.1 class I SAM-dependent methyltransferase [Patescibacteria group bacterium]MDD5396249.1 class I SAM-dependent methyltransferase [Patescibacteria group bacterium]